jgi:hypothetical protein
VCPLPSNGASKRRGRREEPSVCSRREPAPTTFTQPINTFMFGWGRKDGGTRPCMIRDHSMGPAPREVKAQAAWAATSSAVYIPLTWLDCCSSFAQQLVSLLVFFVVCQTWLLSV